MIISIKGNKDKSIMRTKHDIDKGALAVISKTHPRLINKL